MTKLVEITRDDDAGWIWRVIMRRADKRNALNVEMCQLLTGAVERCVANGARVIVIAAEGPVFSAGADLNEPDFAGELYPELEKLFTHIQRLPVPVIAFIEGPAIGAGMLLAMACDLRVAGQRQEIYFSLPVAKMAIGVDAASIRTLEQLIGGSRARQMLLGAAPLDVSQAHECRFIVDKRGDEALAELAGNVAQLAPLTLRNVKMEFAHACARPFSNAERDKAREAAWNSADRGEVATAKLERRPPTFRGR
ncbi:enoyl-CoA hydratase-related protein [Corynebacterium cystitidis]|uniref:Enoyl-CoA hydratase n=1 Tax=Corynebacterium cystitidis DSM 20524 TaxID=1121357 RepID=A0A1H9V617_9CORY|nr:enoyl-CoA hydratase-related protein [Corynebacterium cystitidis]WJY83326.1 putative enoyl-CoA hydratase echA6 [Corynebacterium cystitidis DSM 20524]SES17122.1 enoyl-CoA hydratase [Corynebacterium cystitidis DSM 20524]SNV63239.1 enoyl-CoA hydratase [Corynebacterium cystitidis]